MVDELRPLLEVDMDFVGAGTLTVSMMGTLTVSMGTLTVSMELTLYESLTMES
jgi:hypothetical protein